LEQPLCDPLPHRRDVGVGERQAQEVANDRMAGLLISDEL
jgi:hypothetical protein